MKIRFGKNDAIDTKNIEQEVANITDQPIYQVELTEREVEYIKMFVETVSGIEAEGTQEVKGFSFMNPQSVETVLTVDTVDVESN